MLSLILCNQLIQMIGHQFPTEDVMSGTDFHMISASVYHYSNVTAIVPYSTSLILSMDAPASHFKSMKDCMVMTWMNSVCQYQTLIVTMTDKLNAQEPSITMTCKIDVKDSS